jgi:chemotaxis response regulator CheB
VAFVIVTHLSPDREPLLPEILVHYTSIPVHVAADRTKVESNPIYVMPAGAVLSVEHRTIQVRRNTRRRDRSLPPSRQDARLASADDLHGRAQDLRHGFRRAEGRRAATLAKVPWCFRADG